MARIVHARQTPEGLRFRVWSTITDTYLTPEPGLTAEQMRLWLLEDGAAVLAAEIAERLRRATHQGTSAFNVDVDDQLTAPWYTEICVHCGRKHHAYVERVNDMCRNCGEPADAAPHKPPCGA